MNYWSILVVAVALVFSRLSFAEDLADVVGRSDVIAVVTIGSGTDRIIKEIGNGCGWAYESFVETNVKNTHEGQRIRFRTHLVLDISEAYLVFLTDDTRVDSQQDSFLSPDIASPQCAESGFLFTPIEHPKSKNLTGGREIILPRWIVRNPNNQPGDEGEDYFLASPGLDDLFCNVRELSPAVPIEVRKARFTSKWLAYRAESLVDLLVKM